MVGADPSSDIAVLKAHSYEALTLINNSGNDQNEASFQSLRKALGPGPGTLYREGARDGTDPADRRPSP